MNINLGEKLKALRKEKNISQEKLASYLNVSYQAVSKWENGNTSPDIYLLPDIARFFGITVDELLQVEKLDEAALYQEFDKRSAELYRNGKKREALALWQEAYKKMPNNIEVKEMLMSMYYDVDKAGYREEAMSLARDIYDHTDHGYYRGRAISLLVSAYLDSGNREMAQDWIQKAMPIFCSRDILWTRMDSGDELLGDVSFSIHWFLEEIYYMACRIIEKGEKDVKYGQAVFQTVAAVFEVIYKNDDMSYETMKKLVNMHANIAEDESATTKNETVVRKHLARALALAEKSLAIKAHKLTAPMIAGWKIADAPTDNKQIVRMLKKIMTRDSFEVVRMETWFEEMMQTLDAILDIAK